MTLKEEILAAFHDSWKSFKAAIEPLTSQDMEQPGACGHWSAKDVVGHVASWETELTRRLLTGEDAGPGDPDFDVETFNDLERRRKSRFTVTEQIMELDLSHRALRRALADAPESYFAPGSKSRRQIDANTTLHYLEHASQIRRWAAAQSDAKPK